MTTFNSTFDAPWGDRKPMPEGEDKRPGWSGGPRAWHAMLTGHQHGFGGGPGEFRGFGGRGAGFGGPFGPGGRGPFGRGGGRRARRGDVRLAALLLLAEEPRNGYAIMQELEQRSGGLWRPSPGSVYPALAQLEDEGLIRSRESDGGRVFELTDAGRAHVAERPEDATAPWETVGQGVPDETRAMFGQLRQLATALTQVAQSGSADQTHKATAVMDEARRSIYRILADGDMGAGPEDA